MTSTPDPTRRPARRQPAHRRKHAWRAEPPPGPTNPDPTTPLSEVFLAVGRIVGAHGVRGEVKMEVYTEDPDRLLDLRRVYFNDDPTPQRLTGVRMHGRQALLTFPGITDRDAAEEMRGTVVRISGTQVRPLEEGAFFHYQLIGLSVYLESGEAIGKLSEIISAGEVDVYVVRDANGREQLFPALKDVVLEIDPQADRVVIRPQEWDEE